jgi:hypothetical protein
METVQGSAKQFVRYEFVETGYYDCEAESRRVKFTFNDFHLCQPSVMKLTVAGLPFYEGIRRAKRQVFYLRPVSSEIPG